MEQRTYQPKVNAAKTAWAPASVLPMAIALLRAEIYAAAAELSHLKALPDCIAAAAALAAGTLYPKANDSEKAFATAVVSVAASIACAAPSARQ